jgi:chromosome partitioning protein
LLIDFDPQANLTRRIIGKIAHENNLKNIFEFIMQNDTTKEENLKALDDLLTKIYTHVYISSEFGVSILGSELALSSVMKKLYEETTIMVFRVIDFIKYVSQQFDLVIIYTPPSTDLLTFSAIAASDYYLIPITADIDAVNGALDIINKIVPNIQSYFNHSIKFLGAVLNMSEARTNADKATTDLIKKTFNTALFQSKISRTTKIREINLSFEATIANLKNTKAEKEFIKLADEIMERCYG